MDVRVDHKESWATKNWCFWTVVLEKTLESPLDCKEIKPANPKGNQSWIFIGMTDAEAETLILRPPGANNWLIEKDSDAGKDRRQEEKGMTEDKMVGWDHGLKGHESEQALGAGDGQGSLGCCSPWGRRVGHDWVNEPNWTAAIQAFLSFTIFQSLLKIISIESVMPSNHLVFCFPLLLLPSIFPNIRVFSNESALCIRWPKYWSFTFSISPSSEYSGLISFRMDWLDHLAVQGTLKSLLQHHSSKASILWHSAFFMDQLSHPYMTTGKTIALIRWTFVGKVMSLLFNMLSLSRF